MKISRNIKMYLVISMSIAVIIGGVLLNLNRSKAKEPNEAITENESREIAEEFVKNSPTYKFDGFDLEYQETLYPETSGDLFANTYTFVFTFKCSHGGYGDRTDEPVTQVISPHTAHVTVENGEVTRANLDLKWDMIEQKMLD